MIGTWQTNKAYEGFCEGLFGSTEIKCWDDDLGHRIIFNPNVKEDTKYLLLKNCTKNNPVDIDSIRVGKFSTFENASNIVNVEVKQQ